jgi:hypothetical protein
MFDMTFLTLGPRRFFKPVLIGSVVDAVIGLVLLCDRLQIDICRLPEITGTHVAHITIVSDELGQSQTLGES